MMASIDNFAIKKAMDKIKAHLEIATWSNDSELPKLDAPLDYHQTQNLLRTVWVLSDRLRKINPYDPVAEVAHEFLDGIGSGKGDGRRKRVYEAVDIAMSLADEPPKSCSFVFGNIKTTIGLDLDSISTATRFFYCGLKEVGLNEKFDGNVQQCLDFGDEHVNES